MFEQVVVEADDPVACADALVASIAAERQAVARRFAWVAAWADFHCPGHELPTLSVPGQPDPRESSRQCGADGTPPVTPSGVVELGMLLETSTHSAEALLRDVLELRHRLPQHWEALLTGRIDGWKGRQVAKLTRRLTEAQARQVDAWVIDAVVGLPWGRAKDVIEAKVIAVDPAAHEARLAEDDNKRFVSTRRRSNAVGLRTLIARGHAGDIARLEAMVAHLAALMEAAGDTDLADARRAKALAMLANPALTCVFLADAHQLSPAPATDTKLALDVEPAPDPTPVDTVAEPSAVELAVAFGHTLKQLGAKAVDRLRPKSVLYLHLAAEAVQGLSGCGVARVDDPVAGGPIGIDQLQAWLANDRVTVRPVVDPTAAEPVDGYEVPRHLREAMELLTPYETFPWGTLSARQADEDHTIPYVPLDKGGPPGQTALDNLGPLGRRHHLAKTFDGFVVHQPVRGVYYWRTPTGHWYQVDHRGTRPLGRDRPSVLEGPVTQLDPRSMSAMEASFRDLIVAETAA